MSTIRPPIRDPRPDPYNARPRSLARDVVSTIIVMAVLAVTAASLFVGGARQADAMSPDECAAALAYPDRTQAERDWLTLCASALRPYVAPTASVSPSSTANGPATSPTAGPAISATPAPTLTPPPARTATYTVAGRQLLDPDGTPVVIRGAEQVLSHVGWLSNNFVTEVGKSGANTVRVLPYFTQTPPYGGTPNTLNEIEDQIRRGINAHMLVDVAIDGGRVPAVWTRADVKALMAKYAQFIVIHAKGESYESTEDAWATASIGVVNSLRSAGYTEPLYIMANQGGRNLPTILHKGQAVQDADPLHRVVFGWQAYWGSNNGYQTLYGMTLTQAMDAVAAATVPIQVGLIWRTDPQDGSAQTLDYPAMMRMCQERGVGWLWWDWRMGIDNLTTDGVYGHWATVNGTPLGATVAVTDPNSVQHTSNRTPFQLFQYAP